MDYLVYISALLLTLAGFVFLRVSSRKARSMPSSFALVMLTFAAIQVWPLAWLQRVADPTLLSIHAGLALFAVALLQYAIGSLRKCARPILVCLAVVVPGFGLWILGGPSWVSGVLWTLAGILAAIRLFIESRTRHANFRYALYFMVLGAALTASLVPPVVAFHLFWAPVSPGNPAAMQQIQMFLGAACWLLGAIIWYRTDIAQALTIRSKYSGEGRLSINTLPVVLFLSALVLGWPALNALSGRVDDTRREELVQQTRLGVFSLEDLPKPILKGETAEANDPQYLALKKQLQRLSEIGNYPFAYLIFEKDSDLIFLADSAAPGSEDESVIGDVWTTIPADLKSAILNHKIPADGAITVGPYTDTWGAWVSGISLLPGWEIGGSQVFLGIDRSGQSWQSSLLRIRQAGMGLLSIFVLIVLISFVLHRLSLEAKWRIAHSEERLRMALRGANLAAWEYWPSTRTFHLEEGWCEILDRESLETELAIDDFLEWLHPGDRPAFMETWQKVEAGDLSDIELELRILDGSDDLLFLSLRGKVLGTAADSSTSLISGTAQDITSARDERETLRVLSAALDAAANVVVITDSEGTIEWVNPAFTRVTGYTSDEVVGKNPRILKSGVHSLEFYRALWAKLENGEVWSGEITNRHKDGHYFIEEATITPVVDEYQRITHHIAVKQDITVRKRNVEELERNRKELRRLALVAQNTTNAVVISDTAGRIQWVNPGFERITGYSLNEVIGQSPGSLLQGGETDPDIRARMHDAIAAGLGFKEQLLNYAKDGSPYWISIECVPLKESDGTHIGFMAVEEDITERVQSEETLNRQRANLRHINSTLLNLGDSYHKNLEALTHLVGEIFSADCALYNRLDGDTLTTLGRFNAPAELPFQDSAAGHLCLDVIHSPDGFLCVQNLQQSVYAASDPNVGRFKLDTYIGQGVRVTKDTIGALSVIFVNPFEITDHLKECLFLIAQAIGREELLHMGREKLDQLARKEATTSSRLSTLLQNLNDAVLVEDTERHVIFANPAFESMFGIKASEILGMDCGLLAGGASQAFKDPESFLRTTDEATTNRTPILGELLTLKNGCALVRNFAPISEGGIHHGFLWHYRDVTRQRNNELLLSAVANLATSILEKPLDSTDAWVRALEAVGAPIGVDRTWIFQNHPATPTREPSCSPLAEWTRTGVSATVACPDLPNMGYTEAGLGRWHQDLCEGRAVAGMVKDFPSDERAPLESQGIVSIAVVPVSVDGKLWGFLRFDDCGRGRVWESEEIALLQSAAGLISARLDLQHSEKALVRSESKFRAMFELSPVGMALNDLESGRFLEANKALLEMIGYSLKELQGLNLWELTPEDYREKDTETIRVIRETGSYGPYEKEYFLRSGERLPVLLSGMLVRGQGGKEFVWSIVQNIAERKRWENNLHAAKEAADAANRAKSAFLATMSHEIRTPLNAVIGMSSLLAESPLNSTQRDYAETIINAGETLLELINDILDYSKIEAGRIDLEIADFFLEDVLVESVNLLGGPAAQKGLELSCYLDPALPTVICGDRTRIKQVLINLISNAVKFTASGEVSIRVEAFSSADIPRGIRLSVTDSGVGMTPDVIANLFQPFQQADSSVTRKFGGTGLGLAISRRLAELMNGEIRVESSPGQGSCFSFEIPCIHGGPTKQIYSAQGTKILAGKTILILDDNPTNRRFLNDQCLIWKAVPTQAASAAEALAIIGKTEKPFDVILVDYQMPGMDGAAFARQFRSSHPDSDTVLILLSSAYEPLNAEDRQLFDRTVDKPVRPSSLCKILAGCYSSTPAPPSPDTKSPTATSTLRILVAEDNVTNQKVIRGMLQNLGYSATLVENGALAVEAVQNGIFDLILLDVQMPVIDGLEAARLIRLEPNGTSPHIVALTANAFKEDRQACIQAGMNNYLSKPIRLDLLRELLRQVQADLTASTGHKQLLD